MLLSKRDIIDDMEKKVREISQKMKLHFHMNVTRSDMPLLKLFTVLFFHEMRHDVAKPTWTGRDRIVVSLPFCPPYLFATLAECGYFAWKEGAECIHKAERQFQNSTAMLDIPGVEMLTVSPVLAMTLANGLAIVGKTSRLDYRVYVLLEAKTDARFLEAIYPASVYGMHNITALMMGLEQVDRPTLLHQWFSLGWHVEEVDYEDMSGIFEGFSRVSRTRDRPTVMLG